MAAVILASDEGGFGIAQSVRAFHDGLGVVECLERGIQAVEDDPRALTVGFGGAPDAEGRMSLDASIMEGASRRCGSVGALSTARHPISVARKVMETLPHVLLVGAGAERFVSETSSEQREMLSDSAREDLSEWLSARKLSPSIGPDEPLIPHMDFSAKKNLSFGTVTFLMRDSAGKLAAGGSTSGWAYKYPGRIGDTPLVGAGLYVDDRYGGATCTHTGEMTIRAGTAHSVVMHMRYGKSVKEACWLGAEDLAQLSGGYLGPVIIHAISREGEPYVLQLGETDGDQYWVWREGDAEPSAASPEVYK